MFVEVRNILCLGPCQFHPGAPFFHDAYKGWTCCGKKATDFTEFLNFPGCSRGRHSRVKPVEPENITGQLGPVEDPVPQEVTIIFDARPLEILQTLAKRYRHM
jgi:hypothetical protein